MKVAYLPLKIDNTLDRLCHAKCFLSMDIRNSYWQIDVYERDIEKTAFISPDGLFDFKYMPFELCSGPATLQRLMEAVMVVVKRQILLAYLDDVMLFVTSFDEHLLRRKKTVIDALKSSGLTRILTSAGSPTRGSYFLDISSLRRSSPRPAEYSSYIPVPAASRRENVLQTLHQKLSHIAEHLSQLTKPDLPSKWEAALGEAFKELLRR